ncbi:hypothetical protein Trydic_g18256 [Trypoxylus dichotomus]
MDSVADRTSAKHDMFCARKFVRDLIEIGGRIPCDRNNEVFKESYRLPKCYDADKWKRGQLFFHKHIWSMFFAKIMGLVTILAVPDLAHVLKFTQMSDEPRVAYKRYLATVFHMNVWYNESFYPESKLWKSIEKVKLKHDSASRRSRDATDVFISQKNMALTQFGFMGFAVWKTETVGIYGAERRELEAFVHVWRIIGHLMGIEDRFNICRDSLEETQDICEEIAERVFRPEMLAKRKDFLDLSSALLSGMWCMMPLLQHKVFIHVIATSLLTSTTKGGDSDNNNRRSHVQAPDFHLNAFEKVYARMVVLFMGLFRFDAFRIFHRYVMYGSLWLMEHFPFLAYYSFGRADSHIRILG